MQRNTAISVGLLAVLCVTFVLVLGRSSRRATARPVTAPSASARPPVSAFPAASASASASSGPKPSTEAFASDGFDTLPNGREVPALPGSAPKQVGFGVIVVAYQGAQAAPSDARSKAEAKRRAESLLADAKLDFAAAVAKGDRGSTADAGHVPRNVLEPAIEYLLFTLPKGEVSAEPVDTPRGYWILRRND